jgi:hypothetical protein
MQNAIIQWRDPGVWQCAASVATLAPSGRLPGPSRRGNRRNNRRAYAEIGGTLCGTESFLFRVFSGIYGYFRITGKIFSTWACGSSVKRSPSVLPDWHQPPRRGRSMLTRSARLSPLGVATEPSGGSPDGTGAPMRRS